MQVQSPIERHWPQFVLVLVFIWMAIPVTKAQRLLTGSITALSGESVPFANVLLLNPADSSFVFGTTTNDSGHFKLTVPSNTIGLLKVTSLGFEDHYQPVEPKRSRYDLRLQVSSLALDAVTVTGKKTLYELKPDRMVLNISAAPALSGNTALQLLQRAPGVIVNRQSNSIGMTGKGEVLVMINDKIQRVPQAVLLARLEGMLAENVERIELIHQPAARYDTGGAAGIIHIVLKKQEDEGVNGSSSITAGYGQREKTGLSLNLNARRGKVNIYGDYNYSLNANENNVVDHYREYDYEGNDYYYENLVTSRNRRARQHAANLGLDISLSERTILGLLFSYTHTKDQWHRAPSISNGFINNTPNESNRFFSDYGNRITSAFGNFNLWRQLNDKSELNFDLDFASIDFLSNGTIQRASNTGEEQILLTERRTPVDIWTVQLDNVNTLTPTTRLEIGFKGTFSNVVSRAAADNFQYEWPGTGLFSGTDLIDEQILATYASLSKDLTSQLQAEFGLRYERFLYQLDSDDDTHDRQQQFNNPFPVFRLHYELDSIHTLQLAFNRTITRPTFSNLASYFLFFDPKTTFQSNPQLQPVFTNTLRLSLQRRSILLSLAYYRAKNTFFNFNTVVKEKHLQTSIPTNLDRSDILEASLSFLLSPASWWETNWTLTATYTTLEDRANHLVPFAADLVSYVLQFNSAFSFGKDWSASLDGRYMSPFLYGNQKFTLQPFFNFGISRRFTSGAALSLSVQDITNSADRIEWEYEQPEIGIRTFGLTDWSERQVRLTYTMPFGNQSITKKRARNTGAKEVKNRL